MNEKEKIFASFIILVILGGAIGVYSQTVGPLGIRDFPWINGTRLNVGAVYINSVNYTQSIISGGTGGYDQDLNTTSDVSFTSVNVTTEFYYNDENVTDVLAYPELPYDFIVWLDGSTYRVKHGKNNTEFFTGTDADDVIEWTAGNASNRVVLIKSATYTLSGDIAIENDNVTILIEGGSKFVQTTTNTPTWNFSNVDYVVVDCLGFVDFRGEENGNAEDMLLMKDSNYCIFSGPARFHNSGDEGAFLHNIDYCLLEDLWFDNYDNYGIEAYSEGTGNDFIRIDIDGAGSAGGACFLMYGGWADGWVDNDVLELVVRNSPDNGLYLSGGGGGAPVTGTTVTMRGYDILLSTLHLNSAMHTTATVYSYNADGQAVRIADEGYNKESCYNIITINSEYDDKVFRLDTTQDGGNVSYNIIKAVGKGDQTGEGAYLYPANLPDNSSISFNTMFLNFYNYTDGGYLSDSGNGCDHNTFYVEISGCSDDGMDINNKCDRTIVIGHLVGNVDNIEDTGQNSELTLLYAP